MLVKGQIRNVVESAMIKYAAENNGKKGLRKKDVVTFVMLQGGNMDDVKLAMIEGMNIIAGDKIKWEAM